MNIRSTEQLNESLEAGIYWKYLYFWGHRPSKSGIDKSCLSQWYPASFSDDGNTYATAEHYMMFHKAMLFEDIEAAEKILLAKSPGAAKSVGREVRNYEEQDWLNHRFSIVSRGSELKFSQNQELGDFLRNTQDRILVEASPVDKIWGVGLAVDDDSISDPKNWRGLNLLGFALMEARSRIGI